MENDDLDIHDIIAQKKERTTIKSGSKGKRKERELVKVLTDRFGAGFSRSVGSGNRWGQVSHLPKHAQDTFSGDLVCPEDFLWVFECKGGYNEIDLNNAFIGGITDLDAFLKQADEEKGRTGRMPMLCWKKDRRPWLAFVQTENLPKDFNFEYSMKYRGWTAVALEELLKTPDSYWRSGTGAK
jgi:Holliday junction resolvase